MPGETTQPNVPAKGLDAEPMSKGQACGMCLSPQCWGDGDG